MALRRALVEVEILFDDEIEDPINGGDFELGALDRAITGGHCSGSVTLKSNDVVTPRRMKRLLEEQASDPTFLLGDGEGAHRIEPVRLAGDLEGFLESEYDNWKQNSEEFDSEIDLDGAYCSLVQYPEDVFKDNHGMTVEEAKAKLLALIEDHGGEMKVRDLLCLDLKISTGGACRHCASKMAGEWCSDETCPWSDWPQDVKFDADGNCKKPEDKDRKRVREKEGEGDPSPEPGRGSPE